MISYFVRRFVNDDRGATIVEYSLVVILVAIVALAAVGLAGSEVSETYSDIESGLDWANS